MKAQYIRNAAIALMAGAWLVATPLYAEMPSGKAMDKGAMADQKGGMTQMSGMMHDMADMMMGVSGEMSKGDMNAARQKQMSERMRDMSMMVDNMSGMMGKGMMMDAEQQKKMSDMRQKMDAMNKSPAPGAETKKPAQHLHPRDGK